MLWYSLRRNRRPASGYYYVMASYMKVGQPVVRSLLKGLTIPHSVHVLRLLIFSYTRYKSHLTYFFKKSWDQEDSNPGRPHAKRERYRLGHRRTALTATKFLITNLHTKPWVINYHSILQILEKGYWMNLTFSSSWPAVGILIILDRNPSPNIKANRKQTS